MCINKQTQNLLKKLKPAYATSGQKTDLASDTRLNGISQTQNRPEVVSLQVAS